MNLPDSQLDLRFTPVESVPRPVSPRPVFHPLRLFVDMNLGAKFWFVCFVLTLGTLLAQSWWTTHRPSERVALIDGADTVISAPLLTFKQATNLHLQQAKLATQLFLTRNPLEFDQPELLRLMFLSEAWAKARRQFDDESAERQGKQWHQKAETARVDLLETGHDQILVHVTGQLVRSGLFQERTFAETVPFQLSLKMLRNPNLTQNGRFPTAVLDFRLKYENTP